MKMKRTICLLLTFVLMISMTTVSFGAENQIKVSNRYYYVTEKGSEVLLSSTTKSASDLAKESERKAWIDLLTGIVSSYYVTAGGIAADLVMDAHGYGTAAKINVYSRTDKKYKVDSVTGKKTLASTSHYVIYKLYVKDGSSYSLYKTRTCKRSS